MDKEILLQRLVGIFVAELDDHVHALNDNLLALEKGPADGDRLEMVKQLFRAVHSLKGAARAVSVTPIEAACHRLEDILAEAQERGALDPKHFQLCYETADALTDAGQRLRAGQPLAGSPLEALNARCEDDARGNGTAASPAPLPPARTPAAPTHTDAVPAPPVEDPPPARANGHAPARFPSGIAVNGDGPGPGPRPGPPAAGVAATPAAGRPEHAAAAPPAAEAGSTLHNGGTVRVAVRKLDAFITHHGQVLLLRGRMAARLETLSGLHDMAEQWKNEWRAVEKLIVGLNEDQKSGRSGRSAQARRCAPVLERTAANLGRLERDLERLVSGLADDERALAHASGGLESDVSRLRMLPFVEACQGLDRMVRDLAHASGKDVDLVIAGSLIEIDRAILEGLSDPLMHLVRNAVDHGVESAAERVAAGKPPRAQIEVSAMLRGALIEVCVRDDGRGLDLAAIRARAQRQRMAVPADDAEAAQLIFLPGFSTAPIITEVSGRGVGLDAVKDKIETMRGTADVTWEAGRGTRFVLTTPLTLTTVRAVVLRAGGQTFAVDGTAIQRMVHLRPEELRSIEGREMVFLDGVPVPVVSLAHTLGIGARHNGQTGTGAPTVVLAAAGHQVAFVVDQLLAEQAVVVKNLGARLGRLRFVSGATMLADGKVVLILNPADLMRSALAQTAAEVAPGTFGDDTQVARKRILVTDDSVTSRSMMQTLLEAAGYDVTVTVDGADAWQMLQERGADLVVSDVEMPRMDGFTLTETIRHSSQFRDLPVVLVTARATDQDKARGMEAGAMAYLVKSTFDQKNLLDVVAQLL